MTDLPTVLVTGFGPFGRHRVNPSWSAVELLRDTGLPGVRLVTEQLPVSFARATARVSELVTEYRPDVVVCAGLAASRAVISLERVAVNLADAPVPDVDGAQPVDVPAVPTAPQARLTTLPVKAALARLRRAGIPAELSLSAGTYVCNAVMLAVLQATAGGTARAGFVHVPPEEVLPTRRVAHALELVVRTSTGPGDEVTVPGGRVD